VIQRRRSCTLKASDLLSFGFAVRVLDDDVANPDEVGNKHTLVPKVPKVSALLAGVVNVSGAPLTSRRID
jgi:hypothetical protein